MHIFRNHSHDQQTVGFDHHAGIAGLETDHHIVEIVFAAHPKPFHRSFLHSFSRIAVEFSNPLTQRTVIHSYTDGCSVGLAHSHKFGKTELGGFEILAEVARIYTHLVHFRCHSYGYIRTEMHICHDWNIASGFPEPSADFGNVRNLSHRRHCKADHLCSCLKKPHTLFERSPDIRSVGIAHCLNNYGISSSDDDITDPHRVTCIFYHNSGL